MYWFEILQIFRHVAVGSYTTSLGWQEWNSITGLLIASILSCCSNISRVQIEIFAQNRTTRKTFVPRSKQNQTCTQKFKMLTLLRNSIISRIPLPQRGIPRFNVWLYLSAMKRPENSAKVLQLTIIRIFFPSTIPPVVWLIISVAILILLFKMFAWFVSSSSSIDD